MPITSGSITVLRRVNTGDYSHKEVKAELHYVTEGAEKVEDLANQARIEALFQVAIALASTVKIEQPPELTVAAPEPSGLFAQLTDEQRELVLADPGRDPVSPLQAQVAEETKKRTRRTKVEMEAARAADPTSASDTAPITTTPAPTVPSQDVPATQDAFTDKELTDACNVVNGRIGDANKIRALIADYTSGGAATIEQADRAKFLDRLHKLL